MPVAIVLVTFFIALGTANSLNGPYTFMSIDATDFHEIAAAGVRIDDVHKASSLFEFFLSSIYSFTFTHPLLGYLACAIPWFIGIVLAAKSINSIFITHPSCKSSGYPSLFYCILLFPTTAIWFSTIMREGFQLASYGLLVWTIVTRPKGIMALLAIVFSLLFSSFHVASFAICIITWILSFPWLFKWHPRTHKYWLLACLLSSIIAIFALSQNINPWVESQYTSLQDHYGRTTYTRPELPLPSPISDILSSSFVYLTSPLSRTPDNAWDISLVAYSIFILSLIARCVYIFIFSRNSPDSIFLLFFLCYLVSTAVWAIGTSNSGTAMRHHSTHIIFLLFSAALTFRREANVYINTRHYSRVVL